MAYKQFIPISKKRAIRKDLLYQVLIDDIGQVLKWPDEVKNKFQLLIDSRTDEQVFGESAGMKKPEGLDVNKLNEYDELANMAKSMIKDTDD